MPSTKPQPGQIMAWVQKNFPDHKIVSGGKEIRVNNPFYIDDAYHLWINPHKALVNDFRPNCNVRGSFLWFVKKYRNTTYSGAAKEVMGYVPAALSKVRSGGGDEFKMPQGFKFLVESEGPSAEAVRNYLYSRAVTEEQIHSCGIGHSGLDVVFPYFEGGDIVYWQQRSIVDKSFLFPPTTETHKKQLFVYGIDKIQPGSDIVVTESIFNSLVFGNAVAVGGSTISGDQKAKILARKPNSVTIAFDHDDAGRGGVWKAFNSLKSKIDLYYSLPDDDDDWNDIASKYGLLIARKTMHRNRAPLDRKAAIHLRL